MLQHLFQEANLPLPHHSIALRSIQLLKLLQFNQWLQHSEAITPMLLLSSHRQTLLHLDMDMTTNPNPNPTEILEGITKTRTPTKDLEATTAITKTKEAIKEVSRTSTKGIQLTTISTKVIHNLLHQPQCITTKVVAHTTTIVDTTPTTSQHHNNSSSRSKPTTTATTSTRTLEEPTMLELRASSQLPHHPDTTMDKDRHSISQSSNTTQVVLTKIILKVPEATQTGKTQVSNQT
jgi:hypothetical protein